MLTCGCSVAFGVAFGISAGVLKILQGWNLTYMLLITYAIAIALTVTPPSQQPLHPSLIHTCTSRLFLMKPSLALPGTGGYSPRVADCQCLHASHPACSAGTTTSEVTVPIVLAIGLGIGKAINVQVWPVSGVLLALPCVPFFS